MEFQMAALIPTLINLVLSARGGGGGGGGGGGRGAPKDSNESYWKNEMLKQNGLLRPGGSALDIVGGVSSDPYTAGVKRAEDTLGGR